MNTFSNKLTPMAESILFAIVLISTTVLTAIGKMPVDIYTNIVVGTVLYTAGIGRGAALGTTIGSLDGKQQ